MTLRISSLTTEYVRVPVRVREEGVFVDPTDEDVELAYTVFANPPTEPEESDWVAGSWETDNGRYFARVLTGPEDGDVDPGDGTWHLWVRVMRDPETPVRLSGTVVIT
jgi:hypothetical protein